MIGGETGPVRATASALRIAAGEVTARSSVTGAPYFSASDSACGSTRSATAEPSSATSNRLYTRQPPRSAVADGGPSDRPRPAGSAPEPYVNWHRSCCGGDDGHGYRTVRRRRQPERDRGRAAHLANRRRPDRAPRP